MDPHTDWTHLYEKYEGLWVALAGDESTVVGSGTSPEDALAQAKSNGYLNAALTFVSAVGVTFAAFQR
jgi:hypothetical protein